MQHLKTDSFLQDGKYKIERLLGQGGFGNTYVGFNTMFEERIAIKEFFMRGVMERDETTSIITVSNKDNVQQFEEQRDKFKKEARRLRKLRNEHIVKVHDLFEENGTAYYVMDYIDGESMAERMKHTGMPFTEAEIRSVLPQLLAALREVHQNEIWHLDIKPGNIMLDKRGAAYLIDFGASKQIRPNGNLTTSTALCYTPGYAPNEQIGQMYDRFGPWTDIYALGATIYNLLTNKKPPMTIDIEEDEEDAFSFPNSVSDGMRKMVVWMMQPKRKARPQSVDDIEDCLNKNEMESEESTKISMTEDDKTILSNPSESFPVSIEEEAASEATFLNESAETDGDEVQESQVEQEQTILVVTKSNEIYKQDTTPKVQLPQRAIKVGDFIFEDGSYSDKLESNGIALIGVLFSFYGGTHGQILSAVKPDERLSINGKELKWHVASIAEWVDFIQNLVHCKVSFASWEYRIYSKDVRNILSSYQIKEPRYMTKTSVSGVTYLVDLEKCSMVSHVDDDLHLPYVYITEF